MMCQLSFVLLALCTLFGRAEPELHGPSKSVSTPVVITRRPARDYEVGDKTSIYYSPPTAQEEAAVDAINAHKAASSAEAAARVAGRVAARSVDVSSKAQTALRKARDALQEARAGGASASVEQKESLRRAEAHVKRTIVSVEHSQSGSRLSRAGSSAEVRYVKATDVLHASDDLKRAKAAAEQLALEHKLERLQQQLDKTATVPVDGESTELGRMQGELSELRGRLAVKKIGEAQRDAELEATMQELAEIEAMVRELEIAETRAQVAATEHDALKAELERLRGQVEALEHGREDTGTVVYEMRHK